MPDLLTLEDLASHLKQNIDSASGDRACRYAAGWLKSATKLTVWPSPVPDDLWAWALELAALAYDNPTSLASETIGGTSTTWASVRRQEILTAAATAYASASVSGGPPMYAFPLPVALPDPPRIAYWL